MAEDAIVFAMANPTPEIDPVIASKHAAVVATGRSDFPNQINNVLAFPGFFRGLFDAGASDITPNMLVAAAEAIANRVLTMSSTRVTLSPASSIPMLPPMSRRRSERCARQRRQPSSPAHSRKGPLHGYHSH